MLAIVAVVIAVLLLRRTSGDWSSALGHRPPAGGADGSPQAQAAANYSQTRPIGNSDQNLANGLESALGAGAGAGVCVAYGATAAAPLCAKVGAYLGPKIADLGVWSAKKIGVGAKDAILLPVAATKATINGAAWVGGKVGVGAKEAIFLPVATTKAVVSGLESAAGAIGGVFGIGGGGKGRDKAVGYNPVGIAAPAAPRAPVVMGGTWRATPPAAPSGPVARSGLGHF